MNFTSGVLVAVVLGGCTTAYQDTRTMPLESRSRSTARAIITGAELAATPTASVYEAVRLLRPEFLRTRGGHEPRVYVDLVPIGGVEQLRTLNTWGVAEVRYVSGLEATTRFGTGHTGGAILIATGRK